MNQDEELREEPDVVGITQDPQTHGAEVPVEPHVAAGDEQQFEEPQPDTRLYIPDHSDWDVKIKRDSDRIYCYAKLPGQDYFHLILNGEIYLTRHHERYCLRCALRMNFVTLDRLFWQHRVPKKPPRVL